MDFLQIILVLGTVIGLVACSDTSGQGPAQDQFCATVKTYTSRYLKAMNAHANEAALSQIRYDREHALAGLMTGGKELGWKGEVTDIHTDSDGKARLAVQLSCGQKISHGTSLFQPAVLLNSDPEIEQGTALYATVTGLTVGQKIEFEGEFKYLSDHFHDFIPEGSITEEGSMVRPEFSFAFGNLTTVRK